MSVSRTQNSASSSCTTGAEIVSGQSEGYQNEDHFDHIWNLVVGDNPPEETKKYYNVWAANFDDDMKESLYKGPEILVKYLEHTVKLGKKSKILDVGCGSGLLGLELQQHGYSVVDGLDMSEEMLALAIGKKCYKVTTLTTIAVRQQGKFMPVDYLYDAMLFCSSFQPGHITPVHLEKLANQLSIGGHIVWCCRSLSEEKKANTAFSDHAFKETVKYLKNRCGLVLMLTRPAANFQKDLVGVLGHFRKSPH